MAFPTFVNSAVTTGSGTTLTVTMPASIVAGNFLILFICSGSNDSSRAVTGWTQLFRNNQTSVTFSAHAKVAVGGDTASMSGGVSTTHVAITAQFSGTGITAVNLSATNPASALGALNSTTCPSLTPTAGSQDYDWIAAAGSAGGAYTAGPSGFSTAVIQGTNPCVAFTWKAVTTGTESPGAFSGGGANQLTTTIAVPPVASVAAALPQPVLLNQAVSRAATL